MKSSMAIVGAIALVVGCATGAVVSQLAVPAARAGTNPTKWEYVCGEVGHAPSLQQWANKLGRQGWELGGAAGGMLGQGEGLSSHSASRYLWCFKRPLSTEAPGASTP